MKRKYILIVLAVPITIFIVIKFIIPTIESILEPRLDSKSQTINGVCRSSGDCHYDRAFGDCMTAEYRDELIKSETEAAKEGMFISTARPRSFVICGCVLYKCVTF